MAQRRMFSKTITNSSRFLMMPQSAQNLYFHFGMNADDDGFCEHFTVMRMTESKPDDLKILQVKGLVRIFDDKVLVIRDWKENNYIRSDRYEPSKYLEIYKEELKLLAQNQGEITDDTSGIPMVYQMATQVRIGKDRITSETAVSDAPSLKGKGDTTDSDISVDYNIDPETGEPRTDSLGRRKDGKRPPRREPKNLVAQRLVHRFCELALKNCGTRPIEAKAGYFIVLDAMNKGGLTANQIVKLFGDWFDQPRPDEELVQITRALSHVQVNAWKATNGIK